MSIRRAGAPGRGSSKGRFQVMQLGQESSWDLGELHISAKLERPATAGEITEHINLGQPATDTGDRDLSKDLGRLDSDLLSQAWFSALMDDTWTAAQVAATTVALGAAISSGARKWRQRSLPQGSRLTVTITPPRHDGRQPVHIVFNSINRKSESEITDEIREALLGYTQERKKIDQLNMPKQPVQPMAAKRDLKRLESQKIGKPKHAKSRRKRSRRKR
jgi:hypothetical protein